MINTAKDTIKLSGIGRRRKGQMILYEWKKELYKKQEEPKIEEPEIEEEIIRLPFECNRCHTIILMDWSLPSQYDINSVTDNFLCDRCKRIMQIEKELGPKIEQYLKLKEEIDKLKYEYEDLTGGK